MTRSVRILLALLPLVALVALIAVFALNINRDPSLVQSVLINKPAPQFTLPAVAGLPVPGFDTKALDGQVTVVNVFASWCIPCRDEHPVLEQLKQKTGVPIYGINQKDAPDQAAAFLAQLGNPYDAVGADSDGRTSGSTGYPSTTSAPCERASSTAPSSSARDSPRPRNSSRTTKHVTAHGSSGSPSIRLVMGDRRRFGYAEYGSTAAHPAGTPSTQPITPGVPASTCSWSRDARSGCDSSRNCGPGTLNHWHQHPDGSPRVPNTTSRSSHT